MHFPDKEDALGSLGVFACSRVLDWCLRSGCPREQQVGYPQCCVLPAVVCCALPCHMHSDVPTQLTKQAESQLQVRASSAQMVADIDDGED